jgi:hypothetical protein
MPKDASRSGRPRGAQDGPEDGLEGPQCTFGRSADRGPG